MKKKALRMQSNQTALLIIDIQDKLIKAIPTEKTISWNTIRLIKAANILGIRIYISEQNPTKLGPTVNEISNLISIDPISKMDFSCVNSNEIISSFELNSLKDILICGIETHVCVQQTALDLICLDYNIFIAKDATGSRNLVDQETAIRRLELSGATITTTESSIFEWCNTAERVEFKEISNIIKEKL